MRSRFDEIERSYNKGDSNYEMYLEQQEIPRLIRQEHSRLEHERFVNDIKLVEAPIHIIRKGISFDSPKEFKKSFGKGGLSF